jgi:hypothetical protein
MGVHLYDFHDFYFASRDRVDRTPSFVQVNGPLPCAVALERMVMPTPHFSNLFQTILLDIINPLLKLNNYLNPA